jgi:hypothetical protein
MKMLVAIAVMSAPLLANAEVQLKVLDQHVHTVNYLSSVKPGSLVSSQAWEGMEVVQPATGMCQKVIHTDLRIEKDGDAQKAVYKELISPVECPA